MNKSKKQSNWQKLSNALLHIARQRFSKINWKFYITIVVLANLASIGDGDFFNWKMNGALLFLLILAAFMHD